MTSKIISSIPSESCGYYTFLNHTSVRNLVEKKYESSSISGYFIDGSILYWYLKYCRRMKDLERLSFDNASLALKIFDYYSDRKIFVLGAQPTENSLFKEKLLDQYPNLDTIFMHGYMPFDYYIGKIESCKMPKLVIVGLGSPRQEKFLNLLANKQIECVAFTCGAYISQSAKRWDYYHKEFGLGRIRVLWRFIDEPAKIFKRLTYDIFWFLRNRNVIEL